ncbi:FecR family protein [Butyricimonas virosa]|uniref:FecR family protein n=1 Tax=Butyricimonas virosa TaxID=544645 RepID=UPI0034A0F0C8
MIKKNEINMESEDWEMAERAIKQSGTVKEKLTSQEIGEETFSGKVEEWVEAVHGVSKIDKKKAVEKMLAELKKRDRKKRAVRVWWTAGGSVAAAILVFFTLTQWLQWGKETSDEEKITTVALIEIKVPTLITMEREHGVLSQEILDLKKAKEGYRVKGSGKKEEADVDTSEPIRYNRVVIPAGFTYKVRLADGSVVTLNAGSELKFPEEFRDSLREVEFTGEAYFEVEKSDKPFIVKAGDSRVQVYGTRFNLFYSEKLALAEAVLVEGSIGMTANGKETKIIPHQRVWYSMKDSLMRTENVDPADYLTWLGNSFKYNRTRLDKIVFDIAQWYGVEIKIAPGLEKQAYSLEFDRSATIDWVVRALGLIIDKPIKTEGGAYYIE